MKIEMELSQDDFDLIKKAAKLNNLDVAEFIVLSIMSNAAATLVENEKEEAKKGWH